MGYNLQVCFEIANGNQDAIEKWKLEHKTDGQEPFASPT